MKIKGLLLYILLFAIVLVFSGCTPRLGVLVPGHGAPHHGPVVVAADPGHGNGNGPPPWAPAHRHSLPVSSTAPASSISPPS